MSHLFYRWQADDPPVAGTLPGDVAVSLWQPATDGMPGGDNRSARNLFWWGFDRIGGFASRDFAALSVLRDGRVVHQLVVTPKWHRFPDMATNDLQLGALWTDPQARGQGLARGAIAEVHRRFAGRFARLWYIVGRDNIASIRVIEACGYRLVGEGERTPGPLGQFRITSAPGH